MHHRRKASILRFILLFLYLNDNKIQDIQQPDKYKTDSDQIVKVPRKVTLK